MPMKYDALVFDLDGTLLNSAEDIADSLNQVFQEHDLPVFPLSVYRDKIGGGLSELLENLIPGKLDDDLKTVLRTRFHVVYENYWDKKSTLYDGIDEMLNLAPDYSKKMAILSNKPEHFTLKIIQNLFSSWDFAWVKGSSTAFPNKPHPDSLLHFMKSYSCQPDRTVMIGDTPIDIETAKNAGCISVGVAWGFRPKEELVNASPDFLLEDPSELSQFLNDQDI